MSERMVRTMFGKPDAETDQGSINVIIPEGTFLRIYGWKEWDLSPPFRPSLKAGTVNCSRWSLVDLEMRGQAMTNEKLEWGPDEGEMTWHEAVAFAAAKGDVSGGAGVEFRWKHESGTLTVIQKPVLP